MTDTSVVPRRILALDVGKRRIGLAVSDGSGTLVRGLETLQRTRVRDDVDALQKIASEWGIDTLLIGRPLHMSGDESRQSEYTREFAERLANHTGLPIVYWDERLTSAEAERLLREAGTSFDRKSGHLDKVSAVLLLESYLGYLNNMRTENE